MDVEHRVYMLPPSSTPKGWQDTLDDFEARGYRLSFVVDRVDGWLLIFIRGKRPPQQVAQRQAQAARPATGAEIAKDRTT